MIHELKIDHQWAKRLLQGQKLAEVRRHDRDFQTGDQVAFTCTLWTNGGECPCITGALYSITHVLTAVDGLSADYCVLSLRGQW